MANAQDKRVVYQRQSVVLTNTMVRKCKDAKKEAVEAKKVVNKTAKKQGRPIGSRNKPKKVELVPV